MGWKIPSNWQEWRRREGPKNKWKHMMLTPEEYDEVLRERAAEKGLAMARIRNGDEDESTDAEGRREATGAIATGSTGEDTEQAGMRRDC